MKRILASRIRSPTRAVRMIQSGALKLRNLIRPEYASRSPTVGNHSPGDIEVSHFCDTNVAVLRIKVRDSLCLNETVSSAVNTRA